MDKNKKTQENVKTRSSYKVGNRRLDELTHEELLEAVETLWSSKNEEINKVKAERDGLRNLLGSSFPVHSLWVRYAENSTLIIMLVFGFYLLGAGSK